MIFLTKVDAMCRHVEKDKRLVFHSPTVKELVQKTAFATGLTEMCVMPFVSYTKEHTCDNAIDVLALRSMVHVLNIAHDFMSTQRM